MRFITNPNRTPTVSVAAKYRTPKKPNLGIIGLRENIAKRIAVSTIVATISNFVSCLILCYFPILREKSTITEPMAVRDVPMIDREDIFLTNAVTGRFKIA